MDSSKKFVFPEQILSSKHKILTRFGLGIGVSLIVLTALLFINSSDAPFVSPLFRGFYSSNLNPSSASWRFSFPSSSSPFKQVQQRTKGENPSDEGLRETHLGNLSSENDKVSGIKHGEDYENSSDSTAATVANNESLVPSDVGLAKNNSGDLPEYGKVSDFGAEGVNDQNALEANGTSLANNSTLSSTSMEEKTQFGNFSEGKNGNVTVVVGSNVDDFSSDVEETNSERNRNSYENCDIYDGKWVRVDGETRPYYPPGSCPYIDRDFNCLANGRPDNAFLKWRWQPNGCDIPRLNATDFLEKLRGKKLVFVGDSLNRNMWESLVCILRHSVKDKKRVYEISGRREFKKKGFYAFRFEDYDCSMDFVASPFLVRESSFKGKNGTFETLRLDLMDKTTSMYQDADILIFNTGHWWTHDKTKLGEDYYQEGNFVYPKLKVLEAYRRALTTWARWVDKNIDPNQTHVIFRGYSVTHFRGGPWNLGGQCHNETEPFFDTRYLEKYPSKMRALENVLLEMKTPVTYMNISMLTDFRKDGHPSIYRMVYKTEEERTEAVKHQDCSHWCLPGVPDTWNELLYVSLLKAGIGSWRNGT